MYIIQYRYGIPNKNLESLMMALTEHCPSTWHMLIERLFRFYINIKISSSGVQVSIR